MYEKLKTTIQMGGYALSAMADKLDALLAADRLTVDQWQELRALCLEHLDPDAQRPDNLAMLQALAERVTTLEGRVDTLEGKTPDPDTYPAWTPWDGMSSDYQYGAVVSHNGKLWQSTYNGQNVWEPGTMGTETMWAEYTEEENTND